MVTPRGPTGLMDDRHVRQGALNTSSEPFNVNDSICDAPETGDVCEKFFFYLYLQH